MARKNLSDGVVVIGLGRFGKSLALELEREGIEVLGIDGAAASEADGAQATVQLRWRLW